MAAAVDRKELQAMIEVGKKKGHLTVDDINSLLPMDVTSPDQIDEFMVLLEQNDIPVLLDGDGKGKKGKQSAAQKKDEKEREEKAREKDDDDEKPEAAAAEDYGKSNDPVRMYLRKMGSVSLLTREGEVEIAKRIEEGENEVLKVVLDSSIAVEEILDLGEKLKKQKIRVKDVVRDVDEEDADFDEEWHTERVVKIIDKVRRLQR